MASALLIGALQPVAGGAIDVSDGVKIGVVTDIPRSRPETAEMVVLIEAEVAQLVGSRHPVTMVRGKGPDCDWSTGCLKQQYRQLASDEDVDLIIGLGLLCSTVLARQEPFEKPVILFGIADAQLQAIPLTPQKTSGVPNLNYVMIPRSARADIEQFHQMVAFNHLGIVVNEEILTALPGLEDRMAQQFDPAFGRYRLIPLSDIHSFLDSFPNDLDAVFLGMLYQYPQEQMDRLLERVSDLKLPSFSMRGEVDVRRGVLAGTMPAAQFQKVARRIALNVERILEGEDPASLPVSLPQTKKLYVNMRTAREIGFSPAWDLMTTAELLYTNVAHGHRTVDLKQAIDEVLVANWALQVEDRRVAAGKEDVQQAKAARRPQVQASLSGQVRDEDSASVQQPERVAGAGAAIDQVIFSDAANANVTISKHGLEALKAGRDEVVLDTVLSVGNAYFAILQAKTIVNIDKDNLELSRRNLEIARQREEVGYSGPADVHRWESEVARATSDLVEAQIRLRQRKYEFNQLLARPLAEPFAVKEAVLSDALFAQYGPGLMVQHIQTPQRVRRLAGFLVQEAQRNLPEIQRIDAGIAARRRELKSQSRARWLPSVGLQSSANHILQRDGVGSETDLPSDTSWQATVAATWPLYLGGEIGSRKRQLEIEIEKLLAEKKELLQSLELRVRKSVLDLVSRGLNLGLSRQSAEAADKSLQIVQQSYQKGTISIVELLDAQNAALSARENAINSIYEYMLGLLNVERAVGNFAVLNDSRVPDDFLNRFLRSVQQPPASAAVNP